MNIKRAKQHELRQRWETWWPLGVKSAYEKNNVEALNVLHSLMLGTTGIHAWNAEYVYAGWYTFHRRLGHG